MHVSYAWLIFVIMMPWYTATYVGEVITRLLSRTSRPKVMMN